MAKKANEEDNVIVVDTWIICPDCEGDGVFQRHQDPKTVGIVCHACGGEGKKRLQLTLRPFRGKTAHRKHGMIRKVHVVAGKYGGLVGKPVTYVEWLAGKKPRPLR